MYRSRRMRAVLIVVLCLSSSATAFAVAQTDRQVAIIYSPARCVRAMGIEAIDCWRSSYNNCSVLPRSTFPRSHPS